MGALTTPIAATRPRAYVRVAGPQAAEYLQRMVSNDVQALPPGAACDALLLTPKARVIATLRILRRAEDDFLLLTEPELGQVVRDHLRRARFAARVEIEPEDHRSLLLLGDGGVPPEGATAIPNDDYGPPGWELLDADAPTGAPLTVEQLEALRIRAGTPRLGLDVDDRVLPAEAGLVERNVSFTKGCYPGQEPVARLHYRGHANRSLRILQIAATDPPARDTDILFDGKPVGRITSAARDGEDVVALGYVRSEVAEDASLVVDGAAARMVASSRP